MEQAIQQLLDSFDQLEDEQKREAAVEILRRTAELESPPLDDETLAQIADELFVALDKEESDA